MANWWIDPLDAPYSCPANGVGDDAPGLKAAILAAQAAVPQTVLIWKPLYIKSHITGTDPTKPITYKFARGGMLVFEAHPWTMLFYGTVEAGAYQIMSGASLALFHDGADATNIFDDGARPEWFGAKGDGTTDDTQALTDAFTLSAGGSTVWLRPGHIYGVSGSAGASLLNLSARRLKGENWSPVSYSAIKVLSSSSVIDKLVYSNSSQCALEDVRLIANGKCNYPVHLQTAHATLMRNVSIDGAVLAGVKSLQANVMKWYGVNCSNGGTQAWGFDLTDVNASRFFDLSASLNGKGAFKCVSDQMSNGFSLIGYDFEVNGQSGSAEASMYLRGIASTTIIAAGWFEDGGDYGDSIQLDNCRHVIGIGNRITGAGLQAGTYRAIRLKNGSRENSFFGERAVTGTVYQTYESPLIDSGCDDNGFYDCKRMVQSGAAGQLLAVEDNGARNSIQKQGESWGTAPPTSGFWYKGWKVWNSSPSINGVMGWINTTQGSPGTWGAMRSLLAVGTADPAGSVDMCTVFGTLVDLAGNAIAGATMRFLAVLPAAAGANILSTDVIEATTNASGYFSVDLPRSTAVRVTCVEAGVINVLKTTPNAASQDFSTW